MSMVPDRRVTLPGSNCVSKFGRHGGGIEISSSNCLMLGVDGYAVVWQHLEIAEVTSELLDVLLEKFEPIFIVIT
eukprot:1147941-Pelagomonas_calceolata.AAC.1